jgi:hypothetical protein
MGNFKANGARRAGMAATLVTLILFVTSCNEMPKPPTGPTPVNAACQVSFSLQHASMPSGGGQGVVTVTASQAQCGWTAASEAPWIGGFTSSSGFGSGEVRFQVAANPNDGARQGDIVLNETRFRITQTGASCDVQLSPATQAVPSTGMSGSVVVTAGSSCSWSATSNVGWLVVMSDPSSTGEGTVQFVANANPVTTTRTGLIAIGNQLFTVTQAGK